MSCKGKYHDKEALKTVTYSDGRRVQMCTKCECTVEDAEQKRVYNKAKEVFKD